MIARCIEWNLKVKMKNILNIGLVLVLLMVGGISCTSPNFDYSSAQTDTLAPEQGMSIYDVAAAATVTVETDSGRGSGFVVSGGAVVTAKHVISGAKTISIITNDGLTIPAVVVHESKYEDIAVLRHTGPALMALSLGGTPRIGDPVFVVGTQFGMSELSGYVSSGVVSKIGLGVIYTDAPINPGCSGGPLLNANGKVIGLVLSTIRTGVGVGLCTTAAAIERELALYRGEHGGEDR